MQDFAAAVDPASSACLAYTVASVDPRISLSGLKPYYFGMGGRSAETLDDGTEVTIDILPYPLIKDARGLDALDIAIGLNKNKPGEHFSGLVFVITEKKSSGSFDPELVEHRGVEPLTF